MKRVATAEQLLKNAKWRKANPEKMREYANAYAYRHLNRRIWSVAKQRARKRGIEFSISYDDVVVPEACPILGIVLESGIGKSGTQGGRAQSPSLDRIDPQKGYVPGNVWVISHRTNSMKGAATDDELVLFAKWVMSK